MKTKTLKLNIENQKIIFWILASIIFILILMYSYFVNASVLSVVERKNTNQELTITSSRVAEIESKYFTSLDRVTLNLALSRGFMETETSSFVARKTLTRNILTLNNNLGIRR